MPDLRTRLTYLIDERNGLWHNHMKPLAEKDEMTGEESQRYDRAEARVDELDGEIEQVRKQLDGGGDAHVQRQRDLAAEMAGPGRHTRGVDYSAPTADSDDGYRQAFNAYLARGFAEIDADSQRTLTNSWEQLDSRAMQTEPGAAGGYVVPADFRRTVVRQLEAFGGVRRAGTTVLTTDSGGELQVPTTDDTTNTGSLLAEGTAASETDVTVGQKVMKAHTWSSDIVKVSFQLMQDESVDLAGLIADLLGERIGRAQATYLVSGTGTDQPQGILTGTTVGRTATNTASLTFEDFVELEHSVDPAYRRSAEYVLSDDALREARLITDANNNPIWQPGMSREEPATIHGKPYTVDPDLPNVATGEKPIVFGDLSHYWIRDVRDMQLVRFNERYMDQGLVAFLAFHRMDARKMSSGDPYKVLQMA